MGAPKAFEKSSEYPVHNHSRKFTLIVKCIHWRLNEWRQKDHLEGYHDTVNDQDPLSKETEQNNQQICLRRGKGGGKMTHALSLIHRENHNIINKRGQEENLGNKII